MLHSLVTRPHSLIGESAGSSHEKAGGLVPVRVNFIIGRPALLPTRFSDSMSSLPGWRWVLTQCTE
jgi:hypothetical protein